MQWRCVQTSKTGAKAALQLMHATYQLVRTLMIPNLYNLAYTNIDLSKFRLVSRRRLSFLARSHLCSFLLLLSLLGFRVSFFLLPGGILFIVR